MATYGKTWWGKKWLKTFNGIDCDNRYLSRQKKGSNYRNGAKANWKHII